MCCDISECTEWERIPIEYYTFTGVPWGTAGISASEREVQKESTLHPEPAFPILVVT